MAKKIIIAVVVIILLGLGGFWFVNNSNLTKPNTRTPLTLNDNNSNVPSSLSELLQSKSAQTCTFSTSSDTYSSSGVVYVANGKLRGDFTATVQNAPSSSHMIVEGNTSYIWVDGAKNGLKTNFGSNNLNEEDQQNIAQGIDADANLNYSCTPWVIDNAIFNLPSDVTFTEQNTAPLSSQCAVCDSLTGESKTECLLALKCD